jgi:hypothetical protein
VITENRGTCSTKHALLKQIAGLNHIPGVELIIGMYKMNGANTGNIAPVLAEASFDYLPEAHCYLKINGKRIDLTHPGSGIGKLENDILEEIVIQPEQVGTFKVDYHKQFMKKWLAESKVQKSFEEVWTVRECCIQALSKI